MDAALALLGAKGFAATRAEEVALRAGVSKGTLYLYCSSKEELLKAVLRENLSRLIAEGTERVDGDEGSTVEMLAGLLKAWWGRVSNTLASATHKIMVSEARNFPEIAEFYTREVIQPANELLARTLRRGIAQGEFRSVPVRETTLVLFAPMVFMSLHKHSLGACECPSAQVNTSRMIETHIDIAINGLLQRPALP